MCQHTVNSHLGSAGVRVARAADRALCICVTSPVALRPLSVPQVVLVGTLFVLYSVSHWTTSHRNLLRRLLLRAQHPQQAPARPPENPQARGVLLEGTG